MIIDNEAKLKFHLKHFKKTALKNGAGEFDLYPMFGLYYQENKEKYDMPNGLIFDMACRILIEGEE